MTGTPLQSGYSFYYMRRSKKGNTALDGDAKASLTDKASFTDAVKLIGTARTIEEFWAIYNYLVRPHDLPATTDYHFFREGVKPTWEDPYNAAGGRWTIRLPKRGLLGSRYWEEIMLSLLGGGLGADFPDGEICGAVISVRGHEDVLSVWNKTSNNQRIVNRIRDGLKKLLRLPGHAQMRYHNHPRTPA
mmetsp:Transcript_42727/g.72893  ORF Transcript_42727/g.72893 Transcript_42727/m.72893 type:complete len:189 (+) Transcript_42727:183-749(+)|eukprot:CAMPEP_0183741758 /NCGR_PEP_ID=MMETSP0737-20130205/62958_1 /TAXON_ID=385413 /ORGANISM="Thalassiosira miniscula, Strain CCMP1093" /LENGTH=188 /DNA_ID=CAMNT_0025977201 /DNA_START=115 /DNA_END=681 /DNA_ORIENTATION=+